MRDEQCVQFLQWALPQLHMRWSGFRKVRKQVCKRVDRRISDLGLGSMEAYRAFLDERADEWTQLDSLCRITISRFYRDRGVFSALQQQVLPHLADAVHRRNDTVMRIWSAGCSSGEEAYTLVAMWVLELEAQYPGLAIEVVATDADSNMLQRCRDACYQYSSLKDLPESWHERLFLRRPESYCIRPEYKSNIEFLQQDIRREQPPGPFDLVLCRNLAFTYFDEIVQLEVLGSIVAAMRDGAALVIGAHENLPEGEHGLSTWIAGKRIYRKGRDSVRHSPAIARTLVCTLAALAACTTQGSLSGRYPVTSRVSPVAETDPVPSRWDAADDPAIWVNVDDPGASLIVATDKQSGLLVYGLDGSRRQYLPIGNTNNVDLRTGSWGDDKLTLVAASSRYPSELILLTLDHSSGRLQLRMRHKVALREPYGICMYQDAAGQPYVFLNSTEGTFVQYAVDPAFGIAEVRRGKIRSQPEGCVADDDEGVLYIGEERRGIWRMSARPEDPLQPELFDAVERGYLVADVEGLALYNGARKLLVASSQGNNSFAIYDVADSRHVFSFRVAGSRLVDDVSDTDGIDVTAANLPGYPQGILVVQDGYNTGPDANQNFKIVSWGDIHETIERK